MVSFVLKNTQKNAKISLSILLIFIGLFLLSFNYFKTIKSNLYNEKNIELSEYVSLTEVPEELQDVEIDDEEVVEVTEKLEETESYIGYVSVPDVNIKRGFLPVGSKYNSVNYNVMLIDGSDMPDVKNGNLILAAHRGNSSVSFFDKLYKLEIGAKAYINYNNKEYTYKLVESYEEPKDGRLTIKRDGSKNVLTLITCTRKNKKTQTIFIFERVE